MHSKQRRYETVAIYCHMYLFGYTYHDCGICSDDSYVYYSFLEMKHISCTECYTLVVKEKCSLDITSR